MTTDQAAVDAANRSFWDTSCGTSLAQMLGVTDFSLASLEKFDSFYLGYSPYLLPAPVRTLVVRSVEVHTAGRPTTTGSDRRTSSRLFVKRQVFDQEGGLSDSGKVLPMQQLRGVRVFFFGDSICFGQGVSPHRIWVTRIADALSRAFKDKAEIVVQNPSINGNTTRMALERIAYDVQAHRPDVLIVQFGMNDCNVWETDKGRPRVSPEAFAANLSEIIDRGRTFGASQIILGANHSTTRIVPKLPNGDYVYDDANRHYNAIVREVANTKGAQLVDLEKAFDDSVAAGRHHLTDLLLPDELHLSESGHDLYFAHYLPLVESAVSAVIQKRSGSGFATELTAR